MNRDEKRARPAALPPEVFAHGKRRAIYPREPNDGTWLAVNDAGLCLALINWHTIERQPNEKPESRGRIIPGLIGAANGLEVARQIRRTPLLRTLPFRLLAIDPNRRALWEWQWDLIALKSQRHGWERRHWYSSGYDELEAGRRRAEVSESCSLGDFASLRRLHASHLPQRGPLSICMHRPDATTVSYSEIGATAKRITLRYQSGAPCKGSTANVRSVPRCSRGR